MNNPKIQVYLMTYNRPEMMMEALNSILVQDYDNFEVIVSDNSTDDRTEIILKDFKEGDFKYIRRIPSTRNHSNHISAEASADYFMFFHDDDLMLPNYLSSVMEIFNKNPALAAVGTDCYVLEENIPTEKNNFPAKERGTLKIIDNPEALAIAYLRKQPISPCPSYAYRTNMVSDINADTASTIYADLLFLLDVTKRAPIANLIKPLIYYRVHPGQDSKNPHLRDTINLLRNIYTRTSLNCKHADVINYRRFAFCDYLKYERAEALKKHPKRYKKVFRYMLPYLLKNKIKKLLPSFFRNVKI